VYLPAADIAQFGVTVADLAASEPSERFRRLIAFEVSRARALLDDGAPLIGTLTPGATVAVAGFVAGGRAALRAIERAGYDVLSARPRPTKLSLLRAVRWR
jgi:phytoene/squalene synthetase